MSSASLKVDLIAIGDKCLFPLVFKEAKELRYAANRQSHATLLTLLTSRSRDHVQEIAL